MSREPVRATPEEVGCTTHLHVSGERIAVGFRDRDERVRFRGRWLARREDRFTFFLAGGGFVRTVQVWIPSIDAVEWPYDEYR